MKLWYLLLLLITGVSIILLWLMTSLTESLPSTPISAKPKVSIVYTEEYTVNLAGLERLHSFDIHKYKRIYDNLIGNGVLSPDAVAIPEEITEDAILRVHTQGFLDSLQTPQNVADYLEVSELMSIIPAAFIDKGILKPLRYATGGTLLAGRLAMRDGIAINIGGGYHHAKPDAGEGFCIYADIPIAIRTLQEERKIQRALIIDLDVHQGNGTAICLAGDETTYCFSMHQSDIYPIPKEQSDMDIELSSGTVDDTYLKILHENLPLVFESAGDIDIVFYQAGCDTISGDPLADLEMTEEGIIKRDQAVIEYCVSRQVPVVMTLGGGYSDTAWHIQYSSIRRILESYGL
jgi:histone deacetylase 11